MHTDTEVWHKYYDSLNKDCVELNKLLISIIKKTKENNKIIY